MSNKRNLRLKYLYLILLLFYNCNLLAIDKISINDFSINRGEKKYIPVISDIIFNQSINKLKLTFLFNSKAISINKVISKPNYAINCESQNLNIISFKPLDSAFYSFDCSSINIAFKDTLCLLEIEGLAGNDTSAYINLELYSDEVKFNADYKNSSIKITDIRTFPGFIEDIGYNFPNPLVSTTKFPITIDDKSNININIYSITGQLISDNINNPDNFRLFKNENDFWSEKQINQTLDRGFYHLVFNINTWELSAGTYFLVIQTSKNLLYRTFLVIK
jgi:hypothetical protein